MRIGIDAYFLSQPFNGIGQVSRQVIHALDALAAMDPPSPGAVGEFVNKSCEFYLYLSEDVPDQLSPRCHKRILPMKRNKQVLSKKWWEAIQLPAAVRQDRCDVLISLYQSATVMPRGFPHVMVVHDILFAFFPEFKQDFRKRLNVWMILRGVKRAPHCITVSNYTRNDLIQHLGMTDDRITAVSCAVAPECSVLAPAAKVAQVLQKYKLTPGYLYHGGGNHGRKNVQGVLEAYAVLARQSDAGQLSCLLPPLVISGVYGSCIPNSTDVESVATRLGIRDRVIMVGQVDQEDWPALFRGASVFLFPSYYEGFGLPVLESMHQGTPVVTSNVTSLPEVGGDVALYCNPDRPDEMAAAVRSILVDPQFREALSQRSLARAATFSWDPFLEKLITAAGNLVQRRQSL